MPGGGERADDREEDERPVLSDELLWGTVVDAALELPCSELYPFTQEWDAARVRGKWFMISTVRATRIVILKSDPEDVRSLTETYESITPDYHMNKKHRVTLAPGLDLMVGMVRELVRESYLLVVTSLPRSVRPVDPQVFGRPGARKRGRSTPFR